MFDAQGEHNIKKRIDSKTTTCLRFTDTINAFTEEEQELHREPTRYKWK